MPRPRHSPAEAIPSHSSALPGRRSWIFLFVALLLPACHREDSAPPPPPAAANTNANLVAPRNIDRSGVISAEVAAELARIETREQEVANTLWSGEAVAQEHGRVIDALWDAFNASSNRWDSARSVVLDVIRLPAWPAERSLPHGISVFAPGPAAPAPIPAPGWREQLHRWQADGWELDRTELRHEAFHPATSEAPARSEFDFHLHLTLPSAKLRALIEGPILISWAPPVEPAGSPILQSVDASRLTLKRRHDEAGLVPVLAEHVPTVRNSASIDPLIVAHLGTGSNSAPRLVLPGANVVFRRDALGVFRSGTLFRRPPGPVSAALLGDFDGDGQADVLVMKWQSLVLYLGSPEGTFDDEPRVAWSAPADVRHPMTLTAGDIDHDGDLDVFLAQYRIPYENGSIPTPFHDANDGLPAYLLVNDGHGRFADGTTASGLAPKRLRRTYSASFVDLDGDANLDLVVISDFAGVDILRGDGQGRFEDRTQSWIGRPHAFGMGHVFSDFDGDGRLDLLMMGMTSPTANRLERAGRWREKSGENSRLRAAMIHGSRLYLARPDQGFVENSLGESIARSGWSWGCGAFDLDNDGYPEVYVANGLESRESVADYEREYWLHDAFVGKSAEDPTTYLYFRSKFGRTRGRGQSYGGYDKNRLYLNLGGRRFEEVGHLFGVALEEDSRNVVATDVDGDGRPDLVVTHFEKWPDARQTIRVYRNTLPASGHWIGFRFPIRPGHDPTGVRATVHWAGRSSVRTVVAGDSHRSQHPAELHFGLGAATKVDRVVFQWPDRSRTELAAPAIDRYHHIP